MSSSVSLALQKAIVAALKPALGAAVGIFDRVPDAAPFPYVTVSDHDVKGDLAQGYDGSETHVTLHVWSRQPGKVEAKTLGAQARTALAPTPGGPPPFSLAADGHALVTWSFQSEQYPTDRDGLTTHGLIVVQYLTRPLT